MVPTLIGVVSAVLLLKKAAALTDDRQTAKAFVLVVAAVWICSVLLPVDIDLLHAIVRTIR
jgi:hypothetical protein